MYGANSASEDGNPPDAAFFLILIVLGAVVLARRKISLGEMVRNNVWLTIFFVYCFAAILWSDVPFVAFKRWIKVLGHPIMALVILTHPEPLQALKSVMKRAAVLMLPLSVLFIKYYPHLGRYFDPWTGEGGYAGIHLNKNELGYTCMTFGLFFVWNLAASWHMSDRKRRREELLVTAAFLTVVWWLFSRAGSTTSLVCTVLGGATILLLGTRLVSRRFLGTQIVLALIVAATLEATIGVYDRTIESLGKDPTLTDRTAVWGDLFTIDINPVLGAGFESFWLGWRREYMAERWWWHPNQSHNGYIETYVNLGWVGVFLLLGAIFATFRKGRAALFRDLDEGRLRLAFLFAILAYNYTEAAFKGVHLVWTMFHIVAIDYPLTRAVKSEETAAGKSRLTQTANTSQLDLGGAAARGRLRQRQRPGRVTARVAGVPDRHPTRLRS
jgi:O-antigen ligase